MSLPDKTEKTPFVMKTYFLMNYVPVSAERNYGYCASEKEWMDRHEVWHFKNGDCSPRILQGLAEGIRELKTTDCVVCFIPASTSIKTATRYGDVSKRLQEMTGVPCSHTALLKKKDSEAGHISGKKADPAEDFSFDSSFFSGKTVILIDDVVTRGRTLEGTASRLLARGANDVVALVVARTVNPIFQTAIPGRQIVNL